MTGALIRYRVMAYVVGCLLVVLVCVGVPLKYLGDNDTVVTWTGIPHGWLYMTLIITAFDLGRRARWGWGRLILIALAGTVPFLSFVAEHYATKDVRAKLSVFPEYADQSSLPPEAATVNASKSSVGAAVSAAGAPPTRGFSRPEGLSLGGGSGQWARKASCSHHDPPSLLIFASITSGRSRGPAARCQRVEVSQGAYGDPFGAVATRHRREIGVREADRERSAPSGPKWWTSAPYPASL